MEKKTKEMMEQFIAENIKRVPNNQKGKFNALTLEQKVEKIQSYIDRAKFWEEIAEKNKLSNRVKDLMTKRHATIQDAHDIIAVCNEFINTTKNEELARIDEEIAKLTAMKQSLENK